MSRFKGWTSKDVERLTSESSVDKVNDKKPNYTLSGKSKTKDYEAIISSALNILGIKHIREYKFLHDRRFRFDIAIPEHNIAIEFEGGVWSGGRHTRGKGYINDAKKYNLATMHGWKLLRYTTEDTKGENWEFKIAEEIQRLITKTKED